MTDTKTASLQRGEMLSRPKSTTAARSSTQPQSIDGVVANVGATKANQDTQPAKSVVEGKVEAADPKSFHGPPCLYQIAKANRQVTVDNNVAPFSACAPGA
jgi:hypothetical protein